MNQPEQKLSNWPKNNPDGYYYRPMPEIAEEAGVELGTANRILPVLIARQENVMPSEIKKRRLQNTQKRIDRTRLWELHQKGVPVTDIAFILGCNEGSVRDIIRRESRIDLKEAAG